MTFPADFSLFSRFKLDEQDMINYVLWPAAVFQLGYYKAKNT